MHETQTTIRILNGDFLLAKLSLIKVLRIRISVGVVTLSICCFYASIKRSLHNQMALDRANQIPQKMLTQKRCC